MKRRIGLLLAALFTLGTLLMPAGRAEAADSYAIDSTQVKVEVTADHTYKVQEAISVDFGTAHHGIYRYIPYRYNQLPDLFPRLENIKVADWPYQISTFESQGNRFKEIQIGDPDKTVTGKVLYNLSYDLLVGKETGAQSVRYNLMGNMDTPIKAATFEISLPKSVDRTAIRFFRGDPGSETPADVNYAVTEEAGKTVIRGSLKTPLGSQEYLTFYVPVDEAYFAGAPVLHSWYQTLLPFIFGLMAAAIGLVAFLWFRFGRDKRIIGVVEFFPPEGLSPLEIHKIYKEQDLQVAGMADIRQCTSLIYHLANKGYLTVEFKGKEDFTLERTDKDPSGEEKHLRVFLQELFKKGAVVNRGTMEADFYDVGGATLAAVPDHDVVDGRSVFFKVLGILGMSVPAALAVWGLFDHLPGSMAFLVLIPMVLLTLPVLVLSYPLEKAVSGIARGRGVYTLLTFLAAALAVLAVTGAILLAGAAPSPQLLAFPVLYALTLGGMVSAFFIKKRNDEAVALLGRIRGFRDFIQVAKKNELEKLVADHPSYFFDVLPYAHVLGVSQVLAEKFRDIPMQTPVGYAGMDGTLSYWLLWHHMGTLGHMADSSIAAHQQAARSSFSGGRGFGGGGFSGGGFGGGGGGSW